MKNPTEKKPLRLLGFSGSLRAGSYNSLIVHSGLAFCESANLDKTSTKLNLRHLLVEPSYISLLDLDLPLFNEDKEEECSKLSSVLRWKTALKNADALFISSPEYNGSVSGVLKNAIDWASRQAEGERILECFENKPVLLASASPGNLGGNRALPHLRAVLAQLRCHVYYEQFTVSKAHEVLAPTESKNADPRIASLQSWKDEKQRALLEGTLHRFLQFVYALRLEK